MGHVPYDLEARRPYLSPRFSDAEFDRRVRAVCDAMAAAGLDSLLVYASGAAPSAVSYLTNYLPVYGHVFAVVRDDGRVTVATDGILHDEPMHSMIWTCRVADVRIARGPIYGGTADEVAALAGDAASGARRAGLVGAGVVPQALHRTLARHVPVLEPADHVLAEVRIRKSAEEIAAMRDAGRIADDAYAAVFAALGPDVEETAVSAAAVQRMHLLGAREAFRTCVVSGAQAGLKHAYPRRRRMREGEAVFIDLGADVSGYLSDVSRCTAVGEAKGPVRDLLQIGLDLYHAGLRVVGPGRTIDEVSQALIATVRGTPYEADYCAGGFGHGVGLALLEAPGLFAGNRAELRPGMALAYEPMVVVEGLGTGVVEDTILITETGYERLSNYPVVTWR